MAELKQFDGMLEEEAQEEMLETSLDREEGEAGTEENRQTGKTADQQEIDRIVGERLKRERQKWERALKDKIAQTQAEAEEQSLATAEEKMAEILAAQEQALEERVQAIEWRERRADALGMLSRLGMPDALIECVNLKSEEQMETSVASLKKAFFTAVFEEVNKRMAADAPKTCDTAGSDPFLRGLDKE